MYAIFKYDFGQFEWKQKQTLITQHLQYPQSVRSSKCSDWLKKTKWSQYSFTLSSDDFKNLHHFDFISWIRKRYITEETFSICQAKLTVSIVVSSFSHHRNGILLLPFSHCVRWVLHDTKTCGDHFLFGSPSFILRYLWQAHFTKDVIFFRRVFAVNCLQTKQKLSGLFRHPCRSVILLLNFEK